MAINPQREPKSPPEEDDAPLFDAGEHPDNATTTISTANTRNTSFFFIIRILLILNAVNDGFFNLTSVLFREQGRIRP